MNSKKSKINHNFVSIYYICKHRSWNCHNPNSALTQPNQPKLGVTWKWLWRTTTHTSPTNTLPTRKLIVLLMYPQFNIFWPKHLNSIILWSFRFSCQSVATPNQKLRYYCSSIVEFEFCQLSKPNATQLNSTLKQLALELDIEVTCSQPHPTTHKLFTYF